MERSIGEKFHYNGREIVVVEDATDSIYDGCCVCIGFGTNCKNLVDVSGYCSCDMRKDRKSVHFECSGDGRHLTRHLHESKKSPIATDREQ